MDGRVFIETNLLVLESLLWGDRIIMPIPQLNENLDVLITSLNTSFDGDLLSWTGKIENETGGTVLFSMEGEYVSGAIHTSQGLYDFQFLGNTGWIKLDEGIFNHGESDAVLVE